MKNHTDLPQSRTLAEILSHDTADQTWQRIVIADANLDVPEEKQYQHNGDIPFQIYSGIGLPCWSLSALIDILSDTITDEDGTVFDLNIKKNFIEYYNPSMGALYATYHSIIAEDLVDAAFEMICWLKENGKL